MTMEGMDQSYFHTRRPEQVKKNSGQTPESPCLGRMGMNNMGLKLPYNCP